MQPVSPVDHQDASNGTSSHVRIASIFKTIPPWSWAEFLGWSLAGILAAAAGFAIMKCGNGGIWNAKHRKELVGTLVMGLVAGGGGVVLTWLFKAFGMQ